MVSPELIVSPKASFGTSTVSLVAEEQLEPVIPVNVVLALSCQISKTPAVRSSRRVRLELEVQHMYTTAVESTVVIPAAAELQKYACSVDVTGLFSTTLPELGLLRSRRLTPVQAEFDDRAVSRKYV